MNNSDRENALQALADTMYIGVHRDDYKNGAFKEQITRDTPPLTAIDIFLNSPHHSNEEKVKLREVRAAVISCQENGWTDKFKALMDLVAFNKVTELIEDDMRKRGKYVAPMLLQSVDRDGRVSSTSALDSFGNVESTIGGNPCVAPGAPPGWLKNEIDWHSSHFGSEQNPGNRNDDEKKPGNAGLETPDKETKAPSTKNAEAPAGSESTGWGKEFRNNLRGAFL